MSIHVRVGDPLLSRMLYLEAKRMGFEGDGTSILLIDPMHETIPEPKEDWLVIGVTERPELISAEQGRGLFALLALPFCAKELEETVRRFYTAREWRVERLDGLLYLNGKKILLSHTESKLFDLLYDNRHRLVTEAEMVALLGESATRTNTSAVYLHRLRRKLGEAGGCIRTLRGKGCQWIERGNTV